VAGKELSYAQAVDQARQAVARARLADPDEHYPYKADAVAQLLEENPAAGPAGPDDDSKRATDFMSTRVADASAAYIEAQAAYLRDPGDATLADYQEATDDLVAARRVHRRRRGGAMFVSGQEG
jgi:hypothetical protein